jgi:predicted Rossmann-fold nucleotide-binding protein
MSEKEIKNNIDEHIDEITSEFKNGFELIKKYPKSVTIFGSSRLTSASSHYNDAKNLAERVVKDLNYVVITGGGPGIMEAANLGAKEAG